MGPTGRWTEKPDSHAELFAKVREDKDYKKKGVLLVNKKED